MGTPEHQQTGWVGGSISRIFTSATKRRPVEPEKLTQVSRAPAVEPISQATPRPRVRFQEEREPSPESPVRRATDAQLASRRILDRPQGFAGRMGSTPARTTNFSAAARPRPMFRASHGPDMGKFTFSPRVTHTDNSHSGPANHTFSSSVANYNGGTFNPRASSLALKDNFNIGTPKRDFRASSVDVNGRAMSKTPIRDPFPMKIPEPPAHLTGEAIASKVPHNPNRVGSIYADEYLADLCPKEFNEDQRKQFFCILDLRRLKYASNEIFLKKDWRLNILNFAKEFEKARSLILLRYGLFEFKTIKPSQEAVSQWKAAHGIPDEAEPAKAKNGLSRPNDVEGILGRSGKRKAQEDVSKTQDRLAAPQSKRARATDREPLTETTTPTNKGNKKRMADEVDDMEENPSTKIQRPPISEVHSFLRDTSFLRNVENSTPSQPVSSLPATGNPFAVSASKAKTTAPLSSSVFGAAQNGTAGKSVLSGGLAAGSKGTASPNIFGYLSDAGSGQASGKENNASDDDDSDDEGSDEAQATTSKPTGSTTSSSASPEDGEAPAGRTASLWARFDKGKDGKPIRVSEEDAAVSSPALSNPSAAASENERAASPQKEPASGPMNKTWSPNAPVKFGTPNASSMLSASAAAAASASPAPKASGDSAPLFSFGGAKSTGLAAPSLGSTPNMFGASVNGTSKTAFGTAGAGTPAAESKSSTETATKPQAGALFGGAGLSQSTSPSKTVGDAKASSDAPVTKGPQFGSAPGQASAPTFGLGATSQKSAFEGKPMFGTAPGSDSSPSFGLGSSAEAPKSPPKFGAGPGAAASKSLFGSAAGPDAPKPMFGSGAASDAPKPMFGSGAASDAPKPMFGSGAASDAPKPMFGSGAASDAPKPAFGLGSVSDASSTKPLSSIAATPQATLFGSAPDTNTTSQPKPASVFNTDASQAKPTFSFGAASASSNPTESKPLFAGFGTTAPTSFGASTLAPAEPAKTTTSGPMFTFGNSTPAETGSQTSTAPNNLFGSSAPTPAPAPQPSVLFGGVSAGGPGQSAASQPQSVLFGSGAPTSTSSFTFGAGSATPSFSFGAGGNESAPQAAPATGSGFTFSAGGSTTPFNNPFAGGASSAPQAPAPATTINGRPIAKPSGAFAFKAGGGNDSGIASSNTASMFNFGGSTPANDPGAAAPSTNIFNFGPQMGGTSTGTNTPFTLGGASSLATTPAGGTPEPGAVESGDPDAQKADGDDEEQQAQINLTEGGRGEEEEDVVFEVRAKAFRLARDQDSDDDESSKTKAAKSKSSPWQTAGVGPFRLLKHKTAGTVRALLRGEPRGNIVMNKSILPQFTYKPEKGDKYVKLTTQSDDGTGSETWMLQVKEAEKGRELAAALEKYKEGNVTKKD